MAQCIQGIEAFQEALETPVEVLLVDDGSTDGTADLARELGADLPHFRVLPGPISAKVPHFKPASQRAVGPLFSLPTPTGPAPLSRSSASSRQTRPTSCALAAERPKARGATANPCGVILLAESSMLS